MKAIAKWMLAILLTLIAGPLAGLLAWELVTEDGG